MSEPSLFARRPRQLPEHHYSVIGLCTYLPLQGSYGTHATFWDIFIRELHGGATCGFCGVCFYAVNVGCFQLGRHSHVLPDCDPLCVHVMCCHDRNACVDSPVCSSWNASGAHRVEFLLTLCKAGHTGARATHSELRCFSLFFNELRGLCSAAFEHAFSIILCRPSAVEADLQALLETIRNAREGSNLCW